MKIMYFAFEGFDTKNGTNHLAIKMIDEFLKSNINVYLVSSHSTGFFSDIPNVLNERNGFSYDIIPRNIVTKTNFFQRYLDGFKYAINAMKKWRKTIASVDVIILQSTPTAVFSSILLSLFTKKPVIYNSYDIFPNGPYDIGAITNKHIFKILLFLEKIIYKNSEIIVVISEDMKSQLIKIGVPKSKIRVINIWYDDSSILEIPFNRNKFAKKFNLNEDYFYVQYAGNFGYTFNYKYILDISELLSQNKDIKIQMIGDGAFRSEFVAGAEDRGLLNIDFYPWQPIDMLSDVYSISSVQIIPLSKGVIWNSFPSKSSLTMACRRVFVCATEVESKYYDEINLNKVGICVSNESPQQAVDAILSLYEDEKKLNIIANNALKYAESVYSSSSNISMFIDLLEELN